jgi:thiol-disulfide isomerase/thioredoxin
MKHLFNIILVLKCFIVLGQSNKYQLLKKVNESSKKIKSGSYTVIKTSKFFDFDEIKKEKLEIKFFELGQNTLCIINDLLNKELYLYDTSKWTYVYRYKDSVLNVYTRNNPNNNFLVNYIQPYGFIRSFPFLEETDYVKIEITGNELKLKFKDDDKEINTKNSYMKYYIDTTNFIPFRFQNYSEEWIDETNFNVQNFIEEVSNVKINNFTKTTFFKVLDSTFNSLPIKTVNYPEYNRVEKKIKIVDTIDLINWNLLNTKNNNKFSNYNLNNKPTLFYFTYLGCLPCKMAIPILDSLFLKWNDKVNFCAINVFDKNIDKIKIYKKANNIKFDYYYNSDNNETFKIIKELDLSSYPTFILMNPNKKIVYKQLGMSNSLFENLNSIIKNEVN